MSATIEELAVPNPASTAWVPVGPSQVPLPPTAYGTALPVAPVDGQEFVLVDSVTNPTYQWRFRYNAGSTSPYKWEFVGGSDMYAAVDAQQNCASASQIDLATPGPSLTLPRAGDYEIFVQALLVQGSAPSYNAGISVNGAAGVFAASMCNGAGAGWVSWVHGFGLSPALAAAAVLKCMYYSSSGNTDFAYRRLMLRPKRVS